jgi:hypothetical protein
MPAQKFAFAEGLTPEEEGKVVELAAAVAATVEVGAAEGCGGRRCRPLLHCGCSNAHLPGLPASF